MKFDLNLPGPPIHRYEKIAFMLYVFLVSYIRVTGATLHKHSVAFSYRSSRQRSAIISSLEHDTNNYLPHPGFHISKHERSFKESPRSLAVNMIRGGAEESRVFEKKSHDFSSSFVRQYRQRLAADPNFFIKSIIEICVAASTQLAAEVSRRGLAGILPEIDFVIAGILTAIAGKYYSMWRVAPTTTENDTVVKKESYWKTNVPTNIFQPTLLDGLTKPTLSQRMLALIVPMPSLFQAGIIASAFGYGFSSLLISIRSFMLPDYVAATVNVNIFNVCIYTGLFMAFVSNIRYQLLQGFLEPKVIEPLFNRYPTIKKMVIIFTRFGNGFIGSYLAIMGMKTLGLQRLK